MDFDITWNGFVQFLIMFATGVLGSSITQFIKNKTKLEDRYALGISFAIAFGLAVLISWLTNVLNFADITVENFPDIFFRVLAYAMLYYGWMKKSPSFFGEGGLLSRGKGVG